MTEVCLVASVGEFGIIDIYESGLESAGCRSDLEKNATNSAPTKLVGWKSFVYENDAHFCAEMESDLLIPSYAHAMSIWMVEGLDMLMFLIAGGFRMIPHVTTNQTYGNPLTGA